MPVHNSEIADIFNEVADLLEIEGANEFRVRAYRNAARVVGGLSQSARDLIAKGQELSELPGIGKDLAGKICEITNTGKLPVLEEIRCRVSPQIRELLRVPGCGPKRIRLVCDQLKIGGLEDLKKTAEAGTLQKIRGFGAKTAQKILAEIEHLKQRGEARIKLVVAEDIAHSLVNWLKDVRCQRLCPLSGIRCPPSSKPSRSSRQNVQCISLSDARQRPDRRVARQGCIGITRVERQPAELGPTVQPVMHGADG